MFVKIGLKGSLKAGGQVHAKAGRRLRHQQQKSSLKTIPNGFRAAFFTKQG